MFNFNHIILIISPIEDFYTYPSCAFYLETFQSCILHASLIYLIFWELESRYIECATCDANLRCDKHINITYKTYSKSIYYRVTHFFNKLKRLVFFLKKHLILVFLKFKYLFFHYYIFIFQTNRIMFGCYSYIYEYWTTGLGSNGVTSAGLLSLGIYIKYKSNILNLPLMEKPIIYSQNVPVIPVPSKLELIGAEAIPSRVIWEWSVSKSGQIKMTEIYLVDIFWIE